MTSFQDIISAAREHGLSFLVIGGFAVIFHGYSRDTADLDLLVARKARPEWMDLFSTLGYSVFRDAGNFLQLTPPKAGAWPVDLMVVSESTFEPMMAAGMEVEMYGAMVRIPSLDHLLALKLHVLKHGHVGRFSKDFLDVEGLVRVNALDPRSEKMRQMFLKYGTLDLYEKISRALAG